VSPSNLTHRYYQPLLTLAGLPQIRFHDLRHSAATLMLGANINVRVVRRFLGTAKRHSPWIVTSMSV
jgi:integrase